MDSHASQVIADAHRTHPHPLAPPRHPLGLPAGSVRAILALMVFGLFWALLLVPGGEKEIRIPLYLYYLIFLILGSYFSSRGTASHAPGEKVSNPLYLPRGSLRLIMVVGFIAALGWGFYQDPNILRRLNPMEARDADALPPAYLPLLIVGAFLLGNVLNRLATLLSTDSPKRPPAWFQDVQAWISLLAMIGLGVEVILRLVIYPRSSPDQQFDLPHWEGFLAAVVSFYFGARASS